MLGSRAFFSLDPQTSGVRCLVRICISSKSVRGARDLVQGCMCYEAFYLTFLTVYFFPQPSVD
jgi:hypothetical protein